VSLDVTDLSLHALSDGSSKVKLWCCCSTPQDVADLIAWLELAHNVMEQWQTIRIREASDDDHGERVARSDSARRRAAREGA
jgi:hypothetical protein